MAQWAKLIAVKPGDLSLIPRAHITEGKNEFVQAVLWLLSVWFGTFI